jgi:hypothetical protein
MGDNNQTDPDLFVSMMEYIAQWQGKVSNNSQQFNKLKDNNKSLQNHL